MSIALTSTPTYLDQATHDANLLVSKTDTPILRPPFAKTYTFTCIPYVGIYGHNIPWGILSRPYRLLSPKRLLCLHRYPRVGGPP